MRRGIGNIRTKTAGGLLSCILILLPCLMSAITNIFLKNTFVILAYWLLTAVFCIFAIKRNWELSLSKKQVLWLEIWLFLFVFMVINNNGDLQNGSWKTLLNWFVIIVFSMIVVMNGRFNDKCFFDAALLLLMVQLIAGFYFLAFPNQLLRFSSVYDLQDVWASKFTRMVNSGYLMGFATHYSTSGTYMALGTIITGGRLLVDRASSRSSGKFNIIVFIAFLVALILTGKRAHLLFGIATFLLMYFVGYVSGNFNKRLKQVLGFIAVAVIAFVIALQIPAFSNTFSRFVMTETITSANLNELTTDRWDELWLPALNAFKEHPWLGIGWRQFKYQFPMTQGSYIVNNDCHNIYIQLLCESGIIGFVLFMAVIIGTYVMGWKALKREKLKTNSKCYYPLMFAFGYQTFFLMYGLTGNPLYDVQCYFPYLISCAFIYKYAKAGSAYSLANPLATVRNTKKVERNEA